MTSAATDEELSAELSRLGITVSPAQVQLLNRYRQQLWDWNTRLNLTRHLDLATFASRDVLDGWQLACLLRPDERVLDVGSGGGVPGVILGILRPDVHVTLSESVGKKGAALQAIVRQLNLELPVHVGRAESLLARQQFDTAVARAVGPLWKILKSLQPHWDRLGRLLLIKGPKWADERGEARHRGYLNSLELRRLSSYTTPGHYGENVVLAIYPSAP